MSGIDYAAPVNLVLAALAGLLVLVVTYFVNRFLDRQKKRDAKADMNEALSDGVAFALSKAGGQETDRIVLAARFVKATVPEALKTLAVDDATLTKKVEARLASRTMVM